ncbi:hypothetical protein BKA93DRAFT_730283, partial [Sparassis latifolia]
IKCDSPTCKFSLMHPPDCVPPFCTRNCWQYRPQPQMYSPHIDAYCPNCTAAGLA